jgi:hypothetical protein
VVRLKILLVARSTKIFAKISCGDLYTCGTSNTNNTNSKIAKVLFFVTLFFLMIKSNNNTANTIKKIRIPLVPKESSPSDSSWLVKKLRKYPIIMAILRSM